MEFWKQTKYENYECSNLGNVRNIKTKHILSNKPNVRGYCIVVINKKTTQTHKIICETFHGDKPSNNYSVDHINKIKHDNRPENLRWATHSEQVKNRDVSKQRSGFQIWQICPHTGYYVELFDNSIRVVESLGLDRVKRSNLTTAIKNGSIWNNYLWIYKTIPEKRNETWKEVEYNNKKFLVSTKGRLKDNKNRELNTNNGDYKRLVCNHKDISVHRIVAETFLPNWFNKPCVNHKNGRRYDNRLSNLEWCTYKENMIHRHKTQGC
jgi:hypothetical protein